MVEMGDDEKDPAAHNVRQDAAVVFGFIIEEAEDMRKYARDKLAEVREISTESPPLQAGQYAGMLGGKIGDALTYINKRAESIVSILDILYLDVPCEYKQELLKRRIEDAKMWRHARERVDSG